MAKDVSVLELLEFLQDTIDRAPKVPMSGKVMVDRREIHDTIVKLSIIFQKNLKKLDG